MEARREPGGRAMAVGLLISVAIHAAALGLRFDLSTRSRSAVPPQREATERAAAMHVYNVVPTTASAAAPPADPVAPVPVAAAAPAPARQPVALPDPIRTAPTSRDLVSRTSPRFADPRLWRGPQPDSRALDAIERARAPVIGSIDQLNDSIAAAAQAEKRASDWTLRDEDGERWGISRNAIHLGETVFRLQYCTVEPCPDVLAPPPGRAEEFTNRVRGFDEIRLQASRAALEERLRERADAIRREKRKAAGGEGA